MHNTSIDRHAHDDSKSRQKEVTSLKSEAMERVDIPQSKLALERTLDQGIGLANSVEVQNRNGSKSHFKMAQTESLFDGSTR